MPYKATGKSWTLDVADRADLMLRSGTLVQTFLEDAQRVGVENVASTRAGLRLTEAEHEEFTRRLYELVEEFRVRGTHGEPWSLFIGLHRDDRPV